MGNRERGKRLTRAQADVLKKNKLDPSDYLYIKMETVSYDGSKHLSRDGVKHSKMTVQHRDTKEYVSVYC